MKAKKNTKDVARGSLRRRVSCRLHQEVEAAQGYAYISDAVEGLSAAEQAIVAARALPHAEKVVRILKRYAANGPDRSPASGGSATMVTDQKFRVLQKEAMRACFRRMSSLPSGAFIRQFRVLP